jgi:tRNA dimethylallyltransferase
VTAVVPSPGRVVAVVGATATGKSAVGIALARRLGGEVVNADSMQLYRGMDIGTAKLPHAERGGVPHHLLDIWDVGRTASVADYQAHARSCIAGLHARGVTPVLVGGSGLYVTAAVDAVEFPGTDPGVRAALEADLAAHGPGALHARLAESDPVAAAAIGPANGRKLVRALEVVAITGRPFVARLAPPPAYPELVLVGLRLPRPELDVRLADRVEAMWQAGLVEEVRRLAAAGLREGVTARRALGYAQVLDLIDGRTTEAEARIRTVQATRRFARRQESWFGRDPRIRWLDVSGDPAAVAAGAIDAVGSAAMS